jgi:hypothetical protein
MSLFVHDRKSFVKKVRSSVVTSIRISLQFRADLSWACKIDFILQNMNDNTNTGSEKNLITA